MHSVTARLASIVAVAAALLLTASASGGAAASPALPGDGSAAAAVKISVSDFNSTFRAMAKLKPVTAAGRGSVAVLLPDTVSSVRYVKFDAPYLQRAFRTAGLAASKLIVDNALGSDATQVADAQADISRGARVLILDPLDSGVGAQIESLAKRQGVPVIDYDRFTQGGSRRYYVSFSDVAAGQAMGRGLVSCASGWGVKNPQVIVMNGDPADSNAALFKQGYDQVLAPYFKSHGWKLVSEPAGTWNPPTAAAEFAQQYVKHPGLNAALIPNDSNAAPVIAYLRDNGIKPRTFPVTGQDATLTGLRNILGEYQCGTAYKPAYLEAQGAAALALFLRARLTPPASLLNSRLKDPRTKVSVPSMLLKPVWVTRNNMKSTVVADKFVPVSALCLGYAAACKALGITK